MTKNKISTACDKANHVCDKTQYKEATLWEKIKLNIHLLYCKACRKYTKSNSKLTKAVKNAHLETLNTSTKTEMKSCINKELSKH